MVLKPHKYQVFKADDIILCTEPDRYYKVISVFDNKDLLVKYVGPSYGDNTFFKVKLEEYWLFRLATNAEKVLYTNG